MKQPCKCGRRWEARFFSQFAYTPICAACGKTPKNCTCDPLPVPAEPVERKTALLDAARRKT